MEACKTGGQPSALHVTIQPYRVFSTRAILVARIKIKVGHVMAKVAALWVNLNLADTAELRE